MSRNDRIVDWLWDRMAVALVSAVATALTLIAASVIVAVVGGGMDFGIGGFLLAVTFSKVGLILVGLAAITGFCVGGERMANVFGFFWGTHSFWSKFAACVNSKIHEWNAEYTLPTPILITLLLVCAAVAAWVWLA